MTQRTLRILGVHGVRNYQEGLAPSKAAERLGRWWHNAVCEGLNISSERSDLLSVKVAYYAHRLHLHTSQGDEDPGLLDPKIQEAIVKWAKLCDAPEEVAQGRVTAPARTAVEWVADRFGLEHRPARILASIFFREVNTYFTVTSRRACATSDVAGAIEDAAPNVIIAHSLGSVLGYEALWSYEHPSIDLLLTLGSPLAMPDIVFNRLNPHEGVRGRPPGVARWINIADPGDFIAVPAGGISASFQNVSADFTDAIGAFSFHQVSKYLRCGATAGVLADRL